jgi:hypothetical protein
MRDALCDDTEFVTLGDRTVVVPCDRMALVPSSLPSMRRRNQTHPFARDDGAVNNGDHGNRNKTGFISGENPFLPGGP